MRTESEIRDAIKKGNNYLTWLMIQSPRIDYQLEIAKSDAAIQTLEWVLSNEEDNIDNTQTTRDV
jgi:hypothetical protein